MSILFPSLLREPTPWPLDESANCSSVDIQVTYETRCTRRKIINYPWNISRIFILTRTIFPCPPRMFFVIKSQREELEDFNPLIAIIYGIL